MNEESLFTPPEWRGQSQNQARPKCSDVVVSCDHRESQEPVSEQTTAVEATDVSYVVRRQSASNRTVVSNPWQIRPTIVSSDCAVPSRDPSPVPNYPLWIILVALFCCLPLGITGLIFLCQAQAAEHAGHYDIAMQKAVNTKRCFVSSVTICVSLILSVAVMSLFTLAFDAFNPTSVVVSNNDAGRESIPHESNDQVARVIPNSTTVKVPLSTVDAASTSKSDLVRSNSIASANPPSDFEYSVMDGEVIIKGFKNKMEQGVVCIPAQIEELPVTTIGERAFQWCGGLTAIIIPTSVTSIQENAFLWCSNLKFITIPTSVRTIERYAFWQCNNLRSITIQEGLTNIGDGAFAGCKNLTSITLPKSVKIIGKGSFHGCESLASITFPEEVTSIGYGAFSNCSSLTSIALPESVTTIGGWAFQGCDHLSSILIPKSVTNIGEKAFYECPVLTIQTPTGATAEQYARKFSIPCINID